MCWMCPFCEQKTCAHFIGWTEDGRTLEPLATATPDDERVLHSDDRIVTTGVSARVYRPMIPADAPLRTCNLCGKPNTEPGSNHSACEFEANHGDDMRRAAK